MCVLLPTIVTSGNFFYFSISSVLHFHFSQTVFLVYVFVFRTSYSIYPHRKRLVLLGPTFLSRFPFVVTRRTKRSISRRPVDLYYTRMRRRINSDH